MMGYLCFKFLRAGSLAVLIFIVNDIAAQTVRSDRVINLQTDDTATFNVPPPDFDAWKDTIEHGKTDSVYYYSQTVGKKRRMLIYTPPGYSSQKKYPVLYLLHGIGGDEKEWNYWSKPNLILDNLIADQKVTPMIVVFPNGRAMINDTPSGNIYDSTRIKAFENFEFDLINDLIPFIEAHYSVGNRSSDRAIAGFSMGGGQSLNFGLGHPESFAWVGGFSSAPNTKKPELLIPDPAKIDKKIKLLYISCGNKDGLIYISQRLHRFLINRNISHIYQIQPGEHNIDPWKKDLYNFSQLIFRP